MKKVSFIKGRVYAYSDIAPLPDETMDGYFEDYARGYYECTESFTAEITVKIVPYEQV